MLLVTFYTLAATELVAQSKFRLRPWVDVPETDQKYTQLRMDTDGRLLGLLPNYVFNGQIGGCTSKDIGAGIEITLHGRDKETPEFKAHVSAKIDSLTKAKEQVRTLCTVAGASKCDWSKVEPFLSAGWKGNSGGLWPDLTTVLSATGGWINTYELEYWKGSTLTPVGRVVPTAVTLVGDKFMIPFASKDNLAGPLRFRLKRTDERTRILLAWLDKQRVEHQSTLQGLIAESTGLKVKVDSIMSEWAGTVNPNKCTSVLANRQPMLEDLIGVNNRAAALVAQWKMAWLWYTGDVGVVDPFGRKAIPVKPDTTSLRSDKLKRTALSNIISECKANCSLAFVDSVIELLTNLEDQIKRKEELVGQYNAVLMKRKYPTPLSPDNAQTSHLLYVSTKAAPHFMLHFDYKRNYTKVNAAERTTYYDFEQQHFLVHHYEGDSAALKLSVTLTPEPLKTAIAEDLEGPLTTAAGLLNSNVSPFKTLQAITLPKPEFYKSGFDKGAVPVTEIACQNELIELHEKINQQLVQLAQNFNDLQTILSVMNDVERPVSNKPAEYTTEVKPDTPLEGNNKVAYTLKQTTGSGDAAKSSDVGAGSFKLFKPQRVQVFGGLALTLTDVSRISVTATGGTADVNRTNERLGFFFGLKWHAFKGGTDLSDNNLVFTFRRLAFVGGLGLPNPLDDLYLGFSYDLIPGISVAFMNHWYRNETAVFLNGAITETRSYYPLAFTPAVSLSFDSSLFGNTLKVFSK